MGSSFPQANDKPFLVAPLGLLPLPVSFLFFLHRLKSSVIHIFTNSRPMILTQMFEFFWLCAGVQLRRWIQFFRYCILTNNNLIFSSFRIAFLLYSKIKCTIPSQLLLRHLASIGKKSISKSDYLYAGISDSKCPGEKKDICDDARCRFDI